MTKPILVCMTWRGGMRFERCLRSIATGLHNFSRIILSVTSEPGSPDIDAAMKFKSDHDGVEVICTGRELPTMEHQAFWIDYLEHSGATSSEWIYWLAYDDEVRPAGIHAITDSKGDWRLSPDTAYFGPWAMRHESADALWRGDPRAELESWTSFPITGPTRLPVATWIQQQFAQPTYMQMSGSVIPFANYMALRGGRPRKTGPMRIEMATAACANTKFIEEFPEPISIIYGRSNSDRASYGSQARREDLHLLAWLAKFSARNPKAIPALTKTATTPIAQHFAKQFRGIPLPREEWRVRGLVSP